MAVQEILNAPFTDPFARVRNIQSQTTLQKQGQQAGREFVGAMEDVSQAERAEAEAIATARRAQLAKQKEVTDAEVLGKTTAYDVFEEKTGKMPERTITAFNPERATELAVLTAIMGAFAGSISGRAGLSAMKGISEGYRSGQEDLYKREVDNFNAAMDKYKQEISEAKQVLVNAIEKETLKRGAADVELAGLDPQLAGPVIAAHLKSKNVQRAFSAVETKEKLFQQMQQKSYEAGLKPATSKTASIADEEGNLWLIDTSLYVPGTALQIGTRGVIGKSPKGAGGRAGQYALTYASRVYGNIQNAFQDLENIQNLPAVAQSPVLSGMINRDPETAFSSITALIGRKITNKEARAFDQVANSLSAALARLESQGLASGGTKANIAAFDAVKPRAGDDAINMALYIARVKQEIEVGINVHDKMPGATTEQKAEAQRILRELDRVVPFDTTDVMNTLRQNQAQMSEKMNKLVNTPTVVEQIKPEFIERGGKRFQLNPETGNYREVPSGRP
jgi:hypothetical protein